MRKEREQGKKGKERNIIGEYVVTIIRVTQDGSHFYRMQLGKGEEGRGEVGTGKVFLLLNLLRYFPGNAAFEKTV